MQPNSNQKVIAMTTPTNGKSGKMLILGVVAIGLAAAAVSWWFRYSATHRAAEFWGPEAATLIRDAAHVTLRSNKPSVDEQGGDEPDVPRDISSAKGLTHLRNCAVGRRELRLDQHQAARHRLVEIPGVRTECRRRDAVRDPLLARFPLGRQRLGRRSGEACRGDGRLLRRGAQNILRRTGAGFACGVTALPATVVWTPPATSL